MKVARRETAVSVAAAFLQSNRVDANEALPDGLLPLHLAIDRGLSSVFEILVDTHFADINLAAGEYGQTPLLRAVTARRTIIMDFLLREPHVDVNCTGHNGRNALILAVISGNVHVVERLLSKGVDVNHRDIWGQSAVAYAVLQNTLKVLQALLHDSRVDPNSRNKFGTAPLSIAAWYGDHHVVSLFLRYANIDVDLHNENGDTALSIAEARCVVRKIDGDGIVGPKPGFFSEDNATRNDRDENYEKTIAVIREFICHRQNGYEYRVL
jgi:ankyrin repeat protein